MFFEDGWAAGVSSKMAREWPWLLWMGIFRKLLTVTVFNFQAMSFAHTIRFEVVKIYASFW